MHVKRVYGTTDIYAQPSYELELILDQIHLFITALLYSITYM